jgi:hypothetical protein
MTLVYLHASKSNLIWDSLSFVESNHFQLATSTNWYPQEIVGNTHRGKRRKFIPFILKTTTQIYKTD